MYTNNYQNPINAGYGQGQFRQSYYQQPVTPIQKVSSTLTPEELKMMRNFRQPRLTIKPTETEVIAGKCNHHFEDGSSALEPANPEMPNNGVFRCLICGTEVDFNDVNSQDEADEITKRFTNLQEVVKYSNLSMATELAAQYYGNTIPYNSKMSLLYKQAALDTGRVENGMYNTRVNNQQGAYVFNVLNGGYAAGANTMPYGTTPMQPGTPMQPSYNPALQPAPPQPMGNPLYATPGMGAQEVNQYGQPIGYYTPQNVQPQGDPLAADRARLEEENRQLKEQLEKQQTVRTSQA